MKGQAAIDVALVRIADWYHDHLSEYADEHECDEHGGEWWCIEPDASAGLGALICHAQSIVETLGDDCHMYVCKSCGVAYELEMIDDEYGKPRFCPNCGTRRAP